MFICSNTLFTVRPGYWGESLSAKAFSSVPQHHGVEDYHFIRDSSLVFSLLPVFLPGSSPTAILELPTLLVKMPALNVITASDLASYRHRGTLRSHDPLGSRMPTRLNGSELWFQDAKEFLITARRVLKVFRMASRGVSEWFRHEM